MKTAAQIRDHIREYVGHALRRPAMYHGSPESMEECFLLLDDLLAHIAGDDRGPYAGYLAGRGYGAARFTASPPGAGAGPAGAARFAPFVAFFAAYMQTSPHYRRDPMPNPEGADHA